MTSEMDAQIIRVIEHRVAKLRERVLIGALIVVFFFPLTGFPFAAFWMIGSCLLEGVERALRTGGRLAERLGPARHAKACLGLIFFSNAFIGLFGLVEAFSGTSLGLACGSLMIGGAGVIAVMSSTGSRQATVAAVSPFIIYLLSLPMVVLATSQSALQALQMAAACTLLILAGFSAWAGLSRILRRLETAQCEAEEASRTKSVFLATISHEIRTPLNGILGMAQAMDHDILSRRQRARLDVVTQSGQTLLTLLSDVLDLAKIEAGKLELEVATFDLSDILHCSQAIFRALAQGKGLDMVVEVEPSAAGLWRGDAARLRQILGNLISNAVKFTEAGSVSIRAAVDDGRLVLTVEDSGPGVTEEHRTRLFEKFQQADASTTRRYGGTGLGLSICYELVALMGGSIAAEPVTPHGLRFRVSLPIERADAQAGLAVEPDRAGVVDDRDGRALRVLAAEDHPVNRQVLALLLGQAYIVPQFVENGA